MNSRAPRLLVRLGNVLVEGLALDLCDLELESTRLARAVASCESASTPWGTCKRT